MTPHDTPPTDRDAVAALASAWDQVPTLPTLPTRADVLRVLREAACPLTVPEIAVELNSQTGTPWAVANVAHGLELSGYVTRDRTPPYWVHLTDSGRSR